MRYVVLTILHSRPMQSDSSAFVGDFIHRFCTCGLMYKQTLDRQLGCPAFQQQARLAISTGLLCIIYGIGYRYDGSVYFVRGSGLYDGWLITYAAPIRLLM
jgi:hypothetical protein